MTDQHPPTSLGKRLMPAIALTASAAGLVVLLDRPSNGSAVDLGGGAAAAPQAAPDTTANAAPIPTQTPTPTIAPAQPASPSIVPPPVSSTAPQPTQPTQPKAATGTCEGQKVDGPTVNTRWGPVQVEAVVSSSGQICNVAAIQSPNSHRRSVAINQNALPILHRQVMKAQSTNINGVSGATITSDGYVRSLQALLDGAGG